MNRIKVVASLVVLLGMLLVQTGPAVSLPRRHNTPTGGDWTSFTFDNSNSRYQASSTVTSSNVSTLTKQWGYHTGAGCDVTSTPLVQDGVVYIGDWCGNVTAVSVAFGTLLWSTNVGSAVSGTLLLGDSHVYVPVGPTGDVQEVVALTANAGNVVWTAHLHGTVNGVWASPVEYNGTIYIGVAAANAECECDPATGGKVFALDAATGNLDWSVATYGTAGGAAVWGTIAFDPTLNAIYFGTGNSYAYMGTTKWAWSIVSLDATTGNLNWFHQVYSDLIHGADYDFGSTPNLFTYTDATSTTYQALGLGMKDGNYYVLDRTNGTLLGTYNISQGSENLGIVASAGVKQGTSNNPGVYIAGRNITGGVVSKLAPASGSIVWSTPLDGDVVGSVALVPGAVIVGDSLGNVYALDMSTGAILKKFTLPTGSTPSRVYGGISAAEGMLFVPEAFGSSSKAGVYAYAP